MGVSENVVYPFLANGFADHYPVIKNGYFIGKINPTFSDKPILLKIPHGLPSGELTFCYGKIHHF